jgi:hypothetical protein
MLINYKINEQSLMAKISLSLSFIFLLLCGCTGDPNMTLATFTEIDIGDSQEYVIDHYGHPHRVVIFEGGEEYYYNERFRVGHQLLEERVYVLTLRDGRVVSKRVETITPSANEYDHFEIQTSALHPGH